MGRLLPRSIISGRGAQASRASLPGGSAPWRPPCAAIFYPRRPSTAGSRPLFVKVRSEPCIAAPVLRPYSIKFPLVLFVHFGAASGKDCLTCGAPLLGEAGGFSSALNPVCADVVSAVSRRSSLVQCLRVFFSVRVDTLGTSFRKRIVGRFPVDLRVFARGFELFSSPQRRASN